MVNDYAVRLRRYEDDLYVSGVGAMVMGIWTVVKVIMEVFLGTELKNSLKDEEPEFQTFAMIVAVIFVAVLSYVILKIHLYIGSNAIKAAKGDRYKKGYHTGAIIMLIITALGMISYVKLFEDLSQIDTTIASMLVDVTTIYIFAGVIVSTGRIRKLKEEHDRE